MKKTLLGLIILFTFSGNVLAAGMGKLEVQCPNKQCKIYIDNKYVASGTTLFKVKNGTHKIKVMENGIILLNTNKFIGVNKYIAIKVAPSKIVATIPATIEDEAMPDFLMNHVITAEASSPATVEATPEAAAILPAQPAVPNNTNTDSFSLHYYVLPAAHIEDDYCKGGGALSLGAEFGWNNSLLYDISLNTFSGENKTAIISEGNLAGSSLDIGLVYKLGGFYFGTGTGYYTFNHTLADSVVKAKAALNLDYEETIDSGFGFYCKGGYRFSALGMDLDLGVKGVIVNTVATGTNTDKSTLVETENKINYGLPITTVSLGIIF
jgi:hypothetical protein